MRTTLRMAALTWLLAMTPFLLGQARTTAWVRTFTCSGNGIAQTDTFTLAPGEWRICYRPHGRGPFSVTLRDADSGLNKRLTNQTGPEVASGSSKGNYGIKSAYLVVHGSDDGWQVWVEHYMDTVDEWNFRQSQTPRKALERQLWTGEAAEQTVTVQVTAPHWRFSHEQLRPGRCAGRVRRHRPMPAASLHSRQRHKRNWIHKAGSSRFASAQSTPRGFSY